ncbi:hypothetical protein DPMN_159947 [Dreissena polymorpha]|uniref:Uncharacterized protein n=1 Tax=Dreissena polymorpha TaxID=45954 RepID=A0A9D4EP78_DREPO|nr:hypothetical protein DPMN_159947 [Dreissena polymorpha]
MESLERDAPTEGRCGVEEPQRFLQPRIGVVADYMELSTRARLTLSGACPRRNSSRGIIGPGVTEDLKLMFDDDFLSQEVNTAKAEQTYFAIRGGKAKRVNAASVVEAASVCGGKSHFAAKLRICPQRHAMIRDMMPSRCAS